jgi:LPS-assembly lipoprotein
MSWFESWFDMSWSRRTFLARATSLAALAALGPLAASCGFKPLYGYQDDPTGGTQARLAEIRIVPIAERAGQLLYIDLRERLNPSGLTSEPRWILRVDIEERQDDLLIARDETATRTNLIQRAEFTLTPVGTDAAVLTGFSQATVGYNILENQFATLASEQDARARGVSQIAYDIATRLAVYMSDKEASAS